MYSREAIKFFDETEKSALFGALIYTIIHWCPTIRAFFFAPLPNKQWCQEFFGVFLPVSFPKGKLTSNGWRISPGIPAAGGFFQIQL